MSSQHQPELGGDEAALVPAQTGREEWPKKIRTLSAAELDRLTIDDEGRFYWDGRLVNYRPPGETQDSESQDRDSRDGDSRDREARDGTDATTLLPDGAPQDPAERAQSETARLGALVAPPDASLHPPRRIVTVPAGGLATVRTRIRLSGWQSLALLLALVALIVGAAGLAAQGTVAAHEWGCRTGLLTQFCPGPGPSPGDGLTF